MRDIKLFNLLGGSVGVGTQGLGIDSLMFLAIVLDLIGPDNCLNLTILTSIMLINYANLCQFLCLFSYLFAYLFPYML